MDTNGFDDVYAGERKRTQIPLPVGEGAAYAAGEVKNAHIHDC